MHYFEHSRDEFLQDVCLVGDDFICNLLRQGQNPLHPIAKARGHLVILVLFLQELNHEELLLPPSVQVVSTNLNRDAGNTEDCLCNWVQLIGVNLLLVPCGWERTDLREDSAIFNRPVHEFLC